MIRHPLSLALAAFVCLAGAGPAQADPVQILLAHAAKQNAASEPPAAVSDEFRRQIRELSGGRLRVEVLAGGIMGGNRDTTALVEKGVIHSAIATLGGVTPIHPPLSVIVTPFAFEGADTARKVLDGPFGQRLADDLAAKTPLRMVGFVPPTGFHVLTNSKREVSSPEDMRALRIRTIPGSKPLDAMIKSVGAFPMKVSSSQELASLATGSIDGQMNPAAAILERRFDTVQVHATLLNHLYSPYVWVFNKAFLDGLPPADAEIILAAARMARAKGFEGRAAAVDATLRKNLKARDLTPDERAAFAVVMRPPTEKAIIAAIGAEGPTWMEAFKEAIRQASAE